MGASRAEYWSVEPVLARSFWRLRCRFCARGPGDLTSRAVLDRARRPARQVFVLIKLRTCASLPASR